tara:strand:+ start:94 stop:606 length:513 start_codon:yes stop_codon:yes gene_type:complete
MSKSPVKFVQAAARAVDDTIGNPSQMDAIQNIFASKRERRRAKAQQKANRAAATKRSNVGYADMMRNKARTERLDALTNQPVIETNNSVNNTMVTAPTVAPAVAPAVLDPISRQPMGGVQPVPNIQEQTTPEDVATYGVAGAAESMFGTPMQRQMSMGSSLMKRAYNYKK